MYTLLLHNVVDWPSGCYSLTFQILLLDNKTHGIYFSEILLNCPRCKEAIFKGVNTTYCLLYDMTAMYDLVNCLHFPGFWRTSMTYLICINPAIVYDEVRLFIRYSSNCYFKIVQLIVHILPIRNSISGLTIQKQIW